jgi:hypothetical protein
MNSLLTILSSRTRGEIIRVVCCQSSPVSLEEFYLKTGLRPAAIKRALVTLETAGLIRRATDCLGECWELNDENREATALRRIFELEMFHQIAARAENVLRRTDQFRLGPEPV